MKHVFALLSCFCILLFAGLPVSASDSGDTPETTITSTSTGDADSAKAAGATESALTAHSGVIEPVEVRMETLGEVPYITKVYELAGGAEALPECESFEQDGWVFSLHNTIHRQLPGKTEARFATQTMTVALEEDTLTALQAAAEPSIVYYEDGFTGLLRYSPGDVLFEAGGQTTYSYRATDVREYGALDRNDAAYIPKTVTKNGVLLTLENLEWVVMGTTPVGDSLVPNLFKAIASYSGTTTGSRISGYTATVTYSGTVNKTTPGALLCSVIFRGEPVIPVAMQPGGAPSVLPHVLTALGIIVALGGARTVFWLVRRRKRIADEQAVADELVEKGEW